MKISELLKDKNNTLIIFNYNSTLPFDEENLTIFWGCARWIDGKIIPVDGDTYDDYYDFAMWDEERDNTLLVYEYTYYIGDDYDAELYRIKYEQAREQWFHLMRKQYGKSLLY